MARETHGLSRDEVGHIIGDTAVLCGSGPSLNDHDPWSYGGTVVAVSTAIRSRCFESRWPCAWIHLDPVNKMHGRRGKAAAESHEVIDVFPMSYKYRRSRFARPPYQAIPHRRSVSVATDSRRQPFDDQIPFLFYPHKSTTWAIQWLHWAGVKTVYWVGHDFDMSASGNMYCYQSNKRSIEPLLKVIKTLRRWHPIAVEKGYRWITDSPGKTREFMEIYGRGVDIETDGGCRRGPATV